MPTYEYECRECSYRFEELQSIHDNPLRRCPQCGKLKLSRLISAGTAIIFKGSGFYITDNKSKSAGSGSAQEKSEKKETSSAPQTEGTASKETPKPEKTKKESA